LYIVEKNQTIYCSCKRQFIKKIHI